jgi:hypothetical protein
MRVYEGPANTAFTTGTWPKPPGLKGIKVTVVGGGGWGARGSPLTPIPSPSAPGPAAFGGGGAGGTAIKYYPAPSIPGPQPYRAGGSANTSSFGAAPLTVISGTGGNTQPFAASFGGPGGDGINGDINIKGGAGGRASCIFGGFSSVHSGGVGGMSSLGGGGGPRANGNNYGGGGGGADIQFGTRGIGGVGVVMIEEYY